MAGVEVVDKVGRGDPMNVGRKRKDPSVRVRKGKNAMRDLGVDLRLAIGEMRSMHNKRRVDA